MNDPNRILVFSKANWMKATRWFVNVSRTRSALAAVWILIPAIFVGSVYSQEKPDVNDELIPASSFQVSEGFQAQLVYEVDEQYGSWVSLTTSPLGLIACDQYGKLYIIEPGDTSEDTKVKPVGVEMGHAQGLLWAFDCLYVMANARDKEPAGLYRVTDSDQDGELDSVELLRKIDGGGEHGPHAIILSPDKKSLYVCAGNHTKLTEIQSSRVPRNWQEDNLLPRMWDPGGHAVGIMAPGGWICKTDPDGKNFELISIGFRNEYDIAFDENGELFTYDADMEWDIGTPWYRPTRVCHVTPGSEFGWRGGDAKWPEYYPDSVPAVIDIGPGSPTGIVFGTGAEFPEKYQRALFIADWSFGFIYAIHLQPDGGTWKAEKELFCSAPALQVTDMVVHDGDLFFAIGGRRTQSALYRIKALPFEESPPATRELTDVQNLRRSLESGVRTKGTDPVQFSWQFLNHSDRAVRYAARINLEKEPLADWLDRALSETDPQAALESWMAVCRHTDANLETRVRLLKAIQDNIDRDNLSETQRLYLLRVCGLMLVRFKNEHDDPAIKQAFDGMFSKHYPAKSVFLNRELCRLLVACNAENVVQKTLDLIDSAVTQEEQIHYVMCLRTARNGWNNALRQRYLQWFVDSAVFQGGKSFMGYLTNARGEFVAGLSDTDKAELGALINVELKERDPYAELKSRDVVRKWAVSDLLPAVESNKLAGRDLENGKRIFAQAQCYKCHQFSGSGGIVGPDLTGLSRRYTNQYLLETLIDPNKEISSQFQATLFELEDGRMVTGRIANLSNDIYMVQEDMISPGKLTNIKRGSIESSTPSKVSPMPESLLDTFTQEEILDLIAYLRSADQ